MEVWVFCLSGNPDLPRPEASDLEIAITHDSADVDIFDKRYCKFLSLQVTRKKFSKFLKNSKRSNPKHISIWPNSLPRHYEYQIKGYKE